MAGDVRGDHADGYGFMTTQGCRLFSATCSPGKAKGVDNLTFPPGTINPLYILAAKGKNLMDITASF